MPPNTTSVRCISDVWTCRMPRPRSADASGQLSMDYLLLELRECLMTLGVENDPIQTVRSIRKWADFRLASAAQQLQSEASETSELEPTAGGTTCADSAEHDSRESGSCVPRHGSLDEKQIAAVLPVVHPTGAPLAAGELAPDAPEAPPKWCHMGVMHSRIRKAVRLGLQEAANDLRSPCTFSRGAELLEQAARALDFVQLLEHEVMMPMGHAVAVNGAADTAWIKARCSAPFKPSCQSEVSSARQAPQGALVELAERFASMVDTEIPAAFLTPEGQVTGAAMRNHMRYNIDSRKRAAQRLVTHAVGDLLNHVLSFTLKHLCKLSYDDGVRAFLNAMSECLRGESGDLGALLVKISRQSLLAIWETRPHYASLLANDSVLCCKAKSSVENPCSRTLSAQEMAVRAGVSSPEAVLSWLEDQEKAPTPFDGVGVSATEREVMQRAKALHDELADQFAAPLQLRHASIVPPTEAGGDTTIYLFIDNNWEVTRRALFAKSYTRLYKGRGQKLRVLVIDPKERRNLLKKKALGQDTCLDPAAADESLSLPSLEGSSCTRQPPVPPQGARPGRGRPKLAGPPNAPQPVHHRTQSRVALMGGLRPPRNESVAVAAQ